MSTDITTLFNKDPLEHTREDIDAIIEHMREKRRLFKANPGAVSARKPASTAKVSEATKAARSLDLDLKL